MHKEIEEARALIDGMDSAITKRGIAKAAEMFPQEETGLAAFTLLRNLLALFDRMQKQPVVEISPSDRVVEVAGKMSPGRYRRELEDK